MPSRSTAAVNQNAEPDVSDAFSARVSSVSRLSTSSVMVVDPARRAVTLLVSRQ
jgi:hypothetical protein